MFLSDACSAAAREYATREYTASKYTALSGDTTTANLPTKEGMAVDGMAIEEMEVNGTAAKEWRRRRGLLLHIAANLMDQPHQPAYRLTSTHSNSSSIFALVLGTAAERYPQYEQLWRKAIQHYRKIGFFSSDELGPLAITPSLSTLSSMTPPPLARREACIQAEPRLDRGSRRLGARLRSEAQRRDAGHIIE
ncbi:hypothetical protein E8E11_003918 [Didymella keratinophila]|nr:hypothetical protein E8E11_003918 [Didymella keratinophila]